MPQLSSRRDNSNWLTPSIADILEQGETPPGGDGSIRQQTQIIQDFLSEQKTPVRIVNVRPSPSHTLFVGQPEAIGRLGNRRTVTPGEIWRSLQAISESQEGWTVGFLPENVESEQSIGILLRTSEHYPLSLRRLMIRSQFRNTESTLTLIIGTTLDQELITRQLDTVGSCLVVGTDRSKRHFIRASLLTLALFNTPAELRFAMLGQANETYFELAKLPHTVGKLLQDPDRAVKMLEGLQTEMARRQRILEKTDAATLMDHNRTLADQGKAPIPRIVLIIDSLVDESWQTYVGKWTPIVRNLVTQGGPLGIHVILSVEQLGDLPETLEASLTTQIIMRSAATPLLDDLPASARTALRFIDAFLLETGAEERQITAVEQFVISQQEIEKTVIYWREIGQKRTAEIGEQRTSERTGVTGYLQLPLQLADATQQGTISQEALVGRAAALAAYLGWISVGPLRDVLGLSEGEASAMLNLLQSTGIVETGDSLAPRFVRLGDNPLGD